MPVPISSETRPAILIVDDDDNVRTLLTATLGTVGFTVWPADGAIGALEIFRSRPIDVVLSDVNMPIQMGPELLCELQSIDKDVCCCFMTCGDLADYTVEDLFEMGALAVLRKPFSLTELHRCLDTALRQRKTDSPVGVDRCPK